MVKDNLMNEWRKQRKVTISPSEIGQRPLYDSSIDSDDYEPSAEPAVFPDESIICCKHGIKCSEYYNQKFDAKKISSLWPISELYDQISQPRNWKTSTFQSLFGQKSLRKNNGNIPEMFPVNASKLEILHRSTNLLIIFLVFRFYIGQKPRSASISLTEVAQNFYLYHELPEDGSNLDNLKQCAPLYIVFINNDLEYRHLPVQECFINGKRRFFVECGERNIVPFKKLEHLIQHYANTLAYIDSCGRRTRFPDNPVNESIHKLTISNK
uniref:SH2 domain-containing protein n=1 Tax=Elaeophora elaphi TaxID=1147741 RepID=A0A0R3S1A0_9BILA